MTNNWKFMGKQQIVNGLHYLEKVNPTSDSTGKGVLLIMQGAQFMFGIDPIAYLKKNYGATGSYSEIADKLGDMYSNSTWKKRMWQFLRDHDANFTKVEEKVADQRQRERAQEKHSEIRQAFMIRYPHLEQIKQDIQNVFVKGGKSFGLRQPDKTSPLNEIDVETSDVKMDVFIATIEVRQPKKVASTRSKYAQYSAIINLRSNKFTFTDNNVIYHNYCKSTHKKKDPKHSPFSVTSTFKNLVNLQPFFSQYLVLCKQKYQQLGIIKK